MYIYNTLLIKGIKPVYRKRLPQIRFYETTAAEVFHSGFQYKVEKMFAERELDELEAEHDAEAWNDALYSQNYQDRYVTSLGDSYSPEKHKYAEAMYNMYTYDCQGEYCPDDDYID